MNFSIGTTVGGYEIVGILGSGGMGEVYRVRNVISDRVDAMKVLLASLQRDHDFATRFLREIKVQARLVHPNIAQLYTAFEHEGNLMMILELVDGDSLLDMLQRGRVPLSDAVNYTMQSLSALSYAHEQGVIHRDIKPGNIMVTHSGAVKLMDFGIAKAATDRSLTITGSLIGSLFYMSPEQVRGEAIDSRSDLYSVGVVLYQMATGKKPFEGDSEYSIMRAQVEQAPHPPSSIEPAVPQELSGVIMRSLAKYPAERFQTAEEFRRALEWVAGLLTENEIGATRMLESPGQAPQGTPREAPTGPLGDSQPERPTAPQSSPSRDEVRTAVQEKAASAAPDAPSHAPPQQRGTAGKKEQAPEESPRSKTPLWIGGAIAAAVLVVVATQMFDWMATESPRRPVATTSSPVDLQVPREQPAAPTNAPEQPPAAGADSGLPSQANTEPDQPPGQQAGLRQPPAQLKTSPPPQAPPHEAAAPQAHSAIRVSPQSSSSVRGSQNETPTPRAPSGTSTATDAASTQPVRPAADNPGQGAASSGSAGTPKSLAPAAAPKIENPSAQQQPSPAREPGAGQPSASPPATAAEPAAGRVYEPNEVDTPPRLVQQVQPRYTDEAQKAGVQGRVRLEAEIWPDGRAHNIRVVQSIGRADLDRNAGVALSLWRFAPGRKDGVAVKVRALIDQTYNLQGGRSAPVLKKEP